MEISKRSTEMEKYHKGMKEQLKRIAQTTIEDAKQSHRRDDIRHRVMSDRQATTKQHKTATIKQKTTAKRQNMSTERCYTNKTRREIVTKTDEAVLFVACLTSCPRLQNIWINRVSSICWLLFPHIRLRKVVY